MHMNSVVSKLASFAAGVLFAASTPAIAQTIKWDMAESFPPTSLSGQAAGDFARLVKEKSGGKIEVNVHYSGSLGLGEKDILIAVEQGVVPLSSTILDKVLTTMPLASVQFIPFMAGSMKDGRPSGTRSVRLSRRILASSTRYCCSRVSACPSACGRRSPCRTWRH